MASVLPFDELNRLTLKLRIMFPDGKLPDRKIYPWLYEDILDEMYDLFLDAYAQGYSVTNDVFSSGWVPTKQHQTDVVNKKIAGKTWRERAIEYFDNGGTVDDLIRIAETETHRDANTAALETAQKGGAKNKTWVTMLDERVRDTHEYLEGRTVGINEDFWTFDDDHAPAPGLFELPQNNINCRCELVFS